MPDVAKLVVIGADAVHIANVDQTAETLPLIRVDDSTSNHDKQRIQEARENLKTRKESGVIKPIHLRKVEGWKPEDYQKALEQYGLSMSAERIQRFIMDHPENDMVIVARPAKLSDGHINTHPEPLELAESIRTTMHYPIQGLAAPSAWLASITRSVADV